MVKGLGSVTSIRNGSSGARNPHFCIISFQNAQQARLSAELLKTPTNLVPPGLQPSAVTLDHVEFARARVGRPFFPPGKLFSLSFLPRRLAVLERVELTPSLPLLLSSSLVVLLQAPLFLLSLSPPNPTTATTERVSHLHPQLLESSLPSNNHLPPSTRTDPLPSVSQVLLSLTSRTVSPSLPTEWEESETVSEVETDTVTTVQDQVQVPLLPQSSSTRTSTLSNHRTTLEEEEQTRRRRTKEVPSEEIELPHLLDLEEEE